MRTPEALAAIGVCLLALTGCSTAPAVDPEVAYMEEVGKIPLVAADKETGETMLRAGRDLCEGLEKQTRDEVAERIKETRLGSDGELAEAQIEVLRLAVKYLCPDQETKLP